MRVTGVRALLSAGSLAAVLVLMSACADAPAERRAAAPVVRDSAGVRIVESFPEVWPPPEVWRIPDTPSVTIGMVEGDPDYALFGVQGAFGLPDGGTLVVERLPPRLRYYDANGRHVRTLEREGEGPGEAGGFRAVGTYRGDSIYVITRRVLVGVSVGGGSVREELLVLAGDGAPGRRLAIQLPRFSESDDSSEAGPPGDWGVQATLPDGSWLARSTGRVIIGGRSPGDIVPVLQPLLRVDPSGVAFDTVGYMRSTDVEYRPGDRDDYRGMIGAAEAPPLRSRGTSFYHSPAGRLRVDVYEAGPWNAAADQPNSSERLAASYRLGAPREAMTAAMSERFLDLAVQIYNDELRAEARERLESVAWADSLPAVHDLRVDAIGNIWLELYLPDHFRPVTFGRLDMGPEARPSPWIVLTPEGRLLGRVVVPAGLEVFEIGADYVLGLSMDELGVQYVRRYPILKD